MVYTPLTLEWTLLELIDLGDKLVYTPLTLEWTLLELIDLGEEKSPLVS